jgi:Holliday junction resolvasome RuvABC endonuclease subunit
MQKRILGINPGTRHVGYALFQSSELHDWGIKALRGRWTSGKKKKIGRIFQAFLDEWTPDYIAIKKLHPARSSPELNEQVSEFKQICRTRRIPVYEYPIEYLEKMVLTEKSNKEKLSESLFEQYPILFSEMEKERSNKNSYYARMFEAVALAHVCFNQMDNH